MIPGFTATKKRKSISVPKFYFFDVGVVNYLTQRRNMSPGTADFGHAFEHFVIQEIIAYIGYNHLEEKLCYWRTYSGYEVDVIVGEGRVAIEIKSVDEVKSRHIHGLKAFSEEYQDARLIIVSFDKYKRKMNDVEVFPVLEFLSDLWKGLIIT